MAPAAECADATNAEAGDGSQQRESAGQTRPMFPMWRRRTLGCGLHQEGVKWRLPPSRRHQALGVSERCCVHQQAAPHTVHKMWPYALVQGPLPDWRGSVKERWGPGGPHWGPHSPRCMGGLTTYQDAHAHRFGIEHGGHNHQGRGVRVGGHVHQRTTTSVSSQLARRALGGRHGETAQCPGSQVKEWIECKRTHLGGQATGEVAHQQDGGYRGPLDASQGDS